MSSLYISLLFSPKEMIERENKNVKRKKRRNTHRNISACRIAMIMEFSTHSRYYFMSFLSLIFLHNNNKTIPMKRI